MNMIAVGLMLYVHWAYAVRDEHLLGHALNPKVDRLVRRRILLAPGLYFFGIVLSFISVPLADAIDVIVPILYVLPANFDSIFKGRHDHS